MTYSNTYSSPSSPTNFNPFSGMGMRKGGRPSLFPGSGDGSTLNLDFTTGVLDPRLTFSRASTATFVNSSGYVAWAGANLVLQSGDLSQNGVGQWTTRTNLTLTGWSGISDPFGGSTAVNIIPNTTNATHNVGTADISMSIGIPYTVSVYVKAAGYSIVGLVTTNSNARAHFNLATQTSAGYGVTNTRTITAVGNGWYRITMSFTVASGPLVSLLIYAMNTAIDPVANSFAAGAGDTDGVLAWGAQVNPGSTAQTYYPTTTAAYYAPRFDYSPTNIGEPRGLLVEGQNANITLYSEKLNQSVTNVPWYYANLNTPTVATGIADPYGNTTGTTAWKLVATGTGYHAARQTWTFTAAAYTFSFYAKAAEYDRVTIGDLTSGQGGCSFVLTGNGTATVRGGGTGSPRDPQITPYGTTGWYRCSFTMTMTATAAGMSIVGYPTATTPDAYGASYTADGTSGVYVTMVQVELGSGASSYIPTGASQVTRNADQCELTSGVPALYDSATGTGTLLIDISHSALQNANGGIELGAGTGNQGSTNRVSCRRDATFVGGTTLNLTPTGSAQRFKTVTAFAPSDLAASRNGNSAVTSSTNVTLTGMTALKFYIDAWAGGSLPVYGAVRQVKMWPTRLPNATIQTISAL